MTTSRFKLVIGNKNLSSWSLRPWLVMRYFDIPFTEELVWLDRPESRKKIAALSPSGLVPCLLDDGFAVWDSLAICEYLSNLYPQKYMWPDGSRARARARSLACQMHSGFSNLRSVWPMEFCREDLAVHLGPGVKQDVQTITQILSATRTTFGLEATGRRAGPFLFGRFSIADAMFAPVISRFRTYGPIPMDQITADYMATIWAMSIMQEWGEGARLEGENNNRPLR